VVVSLWEQGGDTGQGQHTRTKALCQGTAAQFEVGKAGRLRDVGGAGAGAGDYRCAGSCARSERRNWRGRV